MKEKPKVTISGSLRKFSSQLALDIEEFKYFGVEVLSPRSGEIVESFGDFVLLRGDLKSRISNTDEINRTVRFIENRHLNSIASSDLVWLIAPGGYFGNSVSLESQTLCVNLALKCEVCPEFVRQKRNIAKQLPLPKGRGLFRFCIRICYSKKQADLQQKN